MSNHAGGQFRKVTLELGGKNPQIVFPDADLDGAMPFIAVGNFLHQGQVCAAGTRVYAHESLVDEVIDRLADHAKQIVLGDPFDENVGMGPVINEPALTKIMGYVESGPARAPPSSPAAIAPTARAGSSSRPSSSASSSSGSPARRSSGRSRR